MPTQKIDPKVIFASDAPAIDKPPVFSDKTKGWDVARANDGRPQIKEMNKMQQDTDLKILWLNENAVLPYDASIDYPDGAVTIKEGSFKQLVSGAWVEFLDDFADKDAVKRGIANRYDSLLAYNTGERVVLANGDIVKSAVDGNTGDPNVDMSGWFLDSSDANIKTWSGRTQEDKNKENPSPFDFGANGDGVTSDTQAFIDLEATHQGRIVDLLGKTYLVDETPVKNTYINGYFLVNGFLSEANGTRNYNAEFTPISIKQGEQSALLRYNLIRSAGNGSGNVVQSIAVDNVNRHLYTFTTHEYGSFADKFNLDSSTVQNSLGRTDFMWGVAGHQGLTIEYLTGKNIRMWSSAAYEIPNSINYTVDFDFVFKAGGYMQEYGLWQLDNTGRTGLGSCTPTISLDQKYLIVRIQQAGVCKIRAWDMGFIKNKRLSPDSITTDVVTNINNNTYTRTRKFYDISEDYCWEFDIVWESLEGFAGTALSHQDQVCDNKYLYILAGNSRTDIDTYMLKYDFLGNLIEQVKISDVGRDDCIAIDTDYATNGYAFREPEGMALVSTSSGSVNLVLSISTAYGRTGARRCFVYQFGGNAVVDAPVGINTQKIRDGNRASGIDVIGENILLGEVGSSKGISGVGNARLQVSSSNTGHGASLNRFSSGTGASYLTFYKSRGDSVFGSDMAAVQSGDYLGFMSWLGNDGSDLGKTSNIGIMGASINARCLGTVSAGNIPTELRFSTAANTGGTVLRFTISPDGNFVPAVTNTHSLGSATYTIKDLYIQNAPIVSSDERLKQQFRSQTQREKDAALEIKNSICLYKFNDAVDLNGDGARWHVGVKAQQVISILESHGLNWQEYAFVCFDEWDATEDHEAGSRYAIRYDELSMFILSSI